MKNCCLLIFLKLYQLNVLLGEVFIVIVTDGILSLSRVFSYIKLTNNITKYTKIVFEVSTLAYTALTNTNEIQLLNRATSLHLKKEKKTWCLLFCWNTPIWTKHDEKVHYIDIILLHLLKFGTCTHEWNNFASTLSLGKQVMSEHFVVVRGVKY